MTANATPTGSPSGRGRAPARFVAACCVAAALVGAGCGRDSPAQQMEQARAALAARDAASAERALKAVLRAAPDTVEARLMLAALYAARHDAPSAEKEWRRALELGAAPGRVLPGLVAARVEAGDPRGALEAARLARVDAAAPRAAIAHAAGRAHAALGDPASAEAAWNDALAAVPGHLPSRVALLRLRAERGDAAGAAAALDALLAAAPASVDGGLLAAELALGRGDGDTARRALARAVEADPADPLPRTRLVSLLIDQRRLADAGAQLDTLTGLAPDRSATRHLRALLDLQEDRLDAASDGVQRLLAADPEFLPAVALGATVALRQGALEQAERLARQLIDGAPRSAQGARLLAQVLLARDEPARAIEVARAASARGIRDATLSGLAGEAALRAGDLDGATRWFEQAAEIDPADPSRLIGLGLARLGTGHTEEGLAALEEAARRDAGSTRADLSLVTALLRAQRFGPALAAADRMVAKAPQSPLGHNLRGTALVGRGDVAGARAAFDRALQLDPAFFAAAANHAQLDVREGRPERARERFEAVLRRDPRSVAAIGGLARLAAQAGHANEERGLLRRAHEADPGALEPALALADALLRGGRPGEALPLLAAAAQRHGPDARLLELQAAALLRTGQVQQALDAVEKRARLEPRSVPLQVQRAAVRAAAGDVDGAIAALRVAGDLDPAAAADLTPTVATMLGAAGRDDTARIARMLRRQAPASPVGAALDGDLAASETRWADAVAAYRDAVALRETPSLRNRLQDAQQAAARGPGAAAGTVPATSATAPATAPSAPR
ncbi:MAG: system TPR-repeat protein PrsT [Pseudomonadota bacterium]|jgi:putative PEP-CTERM system TPR-repeat lipoprotein